MNAIPTAAQRQRIVELLDSPLVSELEGLFGDELAPAIRARHPEVRAANAAMHAALGEKYLAYEAAQNALAADQAKAAFLLGVLVADTRALLFGLAA